jgi:ribosomal protein S8
MKNDLSAADFITIVCEHLKRIEDANARADECVRMSYSKDKKRHFEFIDAKGFIALPAEERARLEKARPIVARVAKKLQSRLHGFARAQGLAEHFQRCSDLKPYIAQPQMPKATARGYYETFADNRSVRNFLEGGAPGLVQQK